MELPLVNQQIFTRCAYMRVSEVGQTKQTDFCIIHCRFFFDGSSSPHLTAFLFIRRFSFKNQFPLFRNQNKQSIRARHRRSISRIRSPSLSGAFLPLYTLDLRSLKLTGLERAISQSVRELTLQQSVSFFRSLQLYITYIIASHSHSQRLRRSVTETSATRSRLSTSAD